ncbi:MAG: rhodanese-like domain-containing protein [Chthoniobacterales bacterium]|nr:rhodanese-like domain-containing protein [Chthoniobacterales bacterium]
MKTINGQQLKEQLDSGANVTVLEALSEQYFRAGHIPGARNLPMDELDKTTPSLVPDHSTPIVVYCASETCANSHTAAKRLTELGYRDVAVYVGGKADWQALGYPLGKAA